MRVRDRWNDRIGTYTATDPWTGDTATLRINGPEVHGTELGPFLITTARKLRHARNHHPNTVWAWKTADLTVTEWRNRLFGQLVENHHYIAGAPDKHAALLLAPGPDTHRKAALEHLLNEAGHSDRTAAALRAWPTSCDPGRTRPLPATEHFLAWQTAVAIAHGPIGYFATATLFEVHPAVAAITPNPWHQAADRAQIDRTIVAELADHFEADRDLGHGDTINELLDGRTIDTDIALSCVALVHATDWAMGTWQGAIDDHYRVRTEPPLRLGWPLP